ncbi:MAG: class I SAM-dependent methyltransferase [Ilumatobacteraceae bacterium]
MSWEDHAARWIDGFTEGADPEYAEQILPLVAEELAGCRRVIDVGCGEGQVTRLAAGLDGVELAVGVDPTRNQLVVASHRASTDKFVRATADRLPFADASFDAAVACLVFEHVDAVDGAIAEVTRILAPGGRFLLLLNHPLIQTPDSGWIDDQIVDPPEQYWRVGAYLPEAVTVEEVEAGVHIRFVHRPLSRYVNALAANGLYVTRMLEPAPPPGFLALAPEYAAAATIPRLLFLRAERLH